MWDRRNYSTYVGKAIFQLLSFLVMAWLRKKLNAYIPACTMDFSQGKLVLAKDNWKWFFKNFFPYCYLTHLTKS